MVQSCFFRLKNIAKIKPALSFQGTEKIVHAVVSSRQDYCNDLFTCLSQVSVAHFHLIQTAAHLFNTRYVFVCNTGLFILTTTEITFEVISIMYRLHWP